MSQRDMFEQSFKRPTNFFTLSPRERWKIDKTLGILDWDGDDLSIEDINRFKAHYIYETTR